jgi:hypothetical protein
MMSYSRALIGHAGQRGAALFMALIILLVLTLLGVVGMNVSKLENLMAVNNQFQTSALNDSEYVLTRGIEDIQGIADAGLPYPFTGYYYDISDTSVQPEDYVWSGFNTQPVTLPDGDTGEYVIVYAGLFNADGEPTDYASVTSPLAGGAVDAFIVSAQSKSSKGAKRTVQSVVATDPLTP